MSNSNSNSSKQLIVRFQRNDTQACDDRMVICHIRGNQYSMTFYDFLRSHTAVSTTVSDREVFRWVRYTLRIIEQDTVQPFVNIQFDFPYMPSILIPISSIATAHNRILDAVDFHLDLMNGVTEAEAEEYDDMPPLIPITPPSSQIPLRSPPLIPITPPSSQIPLRSPSPQRSPSPLRSQIPLAPPPLIRIRQGVQTVRGRGLHHLFLDSDSDDELEAQAQVNLRLRLGGED